MLSAHKSNQKGVQDLDSIEERQQENHSDQEDVSPVRDHLTSVAQDESSPEL